MTNIKIVGLEWRGRLVFCFLATLTLMTMGDSSSSNSVGAQPLADQTEILIRESGVSGGDCPSGYCARIATLDPQSGDVLELVTDEEVVHAEWSPDEQRIAYTSKHTGYSDPSISVVGTDGSNQFEMSMEGYGEEEFSWSPDSTEIAFTHYPRSTHTKLYRREVKFDSYPRVVSAGKRCGCFNPSWSPSGKLIAFAKHGGISLKRPNGLLAGEFKVKGMKLWDPIWFPGGRKLLFLGDSDKNDLREYWWIGAGELARLEVDDITYLRKSELRKLTSEPNLNESQLTFSPNGKKIAFVSTLNGWDPIRNVWVMNRDGSDRKALTHTSGNDAYPVWSPEGKHIAFTSDRGEPFDRDLYVMEADGANQTFLYEAERSVFPMGWRVTSE